ncbi:hypothetical protein ACFY12_32025 [Streptomyces sp. NPDC001339]|uniref:hypothetical protein n=1 Tax=Streptomyces sp. NPDC001339 TaxID=3364563 RepID=UPI0036B00FE2
MDPLIDFGNPQTMNPYACADIAPVTESDPDGLFGGATFHVGTRVASAGHRAGVRLR